MAKKKSTLNIPRGYRKKIQEQKKTSQAIQNSQEKLVDSAKLKMGDDVEVNNNSEHKMSKIIMEYAKPLLVDASSPDEIKNAISVAIASWNLALTNEDQRYNLVEKIMNTISESDDGATDLNHAFFKGMIDRKMKLFPEITRVIVDFDFVETKKGIHLNIASNSPEEQV